MEIEMNFVAQYNEFVNALNVLESTVREHENNKHSEIHREAARIARVRVLQLFNYQLTLIQTQ